MPWQKGLVPSHLCLLTHSSDVDSSRLCEALTDTLSFKKGRVLITQSCLTLCDPMDCNPPGSSVHSILQARILEWVAIPFSRGSSQLRDRTWAYMNCRQILYSLSHQGSTRKCLSISSNISSALISLFPPSVTSVYFLLYHFVFSNNS